MAALRNATEIHTLLTFSVSILKEQSGWDEETAQLEKIICKLMEADQ